MLGRSQHDKQLALKNKIAGNTGKQIGSLEVDPFRNDKIQPTLGSKNEVVFAKLDESPE